MGTDVRKLAYDGYPAARIFGCELRPEYIALGHELFNDSPASCAIRFLSGNVFDMPVSPSESEPSPVPPGSLEMVTDLTQLHGKLTHIYAGALFHLFDEAVQRALAFRSALLLKRDTGAVIFGRHQGLEEAGMIDDHLGRYVRVFPILSPY